MATFDLTSPEVWYPIPSLPGYEISSHHRVGSFWTNHGITRKTRRILAVQHSDTDNGRRPYVNIRVPWATKNRRPHQIVHVAWMVAEVAHGPRPDGLMVLHRDDNPGNNDPSNLYYGTKADNMEDAIRNGRWRPAWGAGNGGPKLTGDDLVVVRRLAERGVPQTIIASLLGVDRSHVSKILSGDKCAVPPEAWPLPAGGSG